MKALTVLQPFAWLIVAGLKPIENRTWTTAHRGPLLIHAGLRPHNIPLAEIEQRYGVAIAVDQLLFGGVIGCVELVEIVTRSDSKWFHGPNGWVLRDARILPFRAARGQRGRLFDVGD